jgi:hypothetical protein
VFLLSLLWKAEAATLAEARMQLQERLQQLVLKDEDVHEAGYVHPDGYTRPCDEQPAGYRLLEVTSLCTAAAPPDDDHRDMVVYLAVPQLLKAPALELTHSLTDSRLGEWAVALEAQLAAEEKSQLLIWHEGKWLPVTDYLNQHLPKEEEGD